MKKFLLGLFTGVALLQIIDSLTELVQVAIEIPKGKLSKKVIKLNKEISDISGEENANNSTYCIGFQAPEDEYYDEDEEYDDGE